MKKLIGVLALLAMGAGLACAHGVGEQEDKAAIAALWVEYGQSRADGDAARWLAIHEEAALKMPQDGPMFRIADVRHAAGAWKTRRGPQCRCTSNLGVVVLGDYAYSWGRTPKATPKGGGNLPVRGKF
jgi:hypothetical protein